MLDEGDRLLDQGILGLGLILTTFHVFPSAWRNAAAISTIITVYVLFLAFTLSSGSSVLAIRCNAMLTDVRFPEGDRPHRRHPPSRPADAMLLGHD